MVAHMARIETRMRFARTGAPANARAALTPTVLSSVLLPDIFEPLIMRTGRSRLSLTEFGTHCANGKRGCQDRKSTRLNSSHVRISYADFCLKKKHTAQTTVPSCTAN